MVAFPTTLHEINKELRRIEMSYQSEKECYERYGYPYDLTNKHREQIYLRFLGNFHDDRGEMWYKKMKIYLSRIWLTSSI
jgi:hypothetical protein